MKNNQVLKAKKQLNDSSVSSVSFLFENRRVSYIMQQGKNYLDKKIFYREDISMVSDREKIYRKLKERSFFEQKYNFIDISILNDKFTLIPTEYFDEDIAEIVLNHTVPFSKNMGIRFNLVPQFNLVLVFYYPEELDDIFAESSEKIRITHTGFKFLSKIKNSHKQNGFFINTYDACFEIAIVEDEKLILYNIYPYKIIDDIIYFLQVISKNTGNKLSDAVMYYYGNLDKNKENFDRLSQYFKEVNRGIEDDFERENYTIIDVL
ncbi:MAG: DUF3822 family protein [Flavobacteriaceae bacterium]|jgi:hypothetical protein|nr:DUF3822 family protein [Flavobacteriaceae bacterium]